MLVTQAQKLSKSFKIKLGGAFTGEVSVDGSADVTLTLTPKAINPSWERKYSNRRPWICQGYQGN